MTFRLPARSGLLLLQAACLFAYVFSLTLPALEFDKSFPGDQTGLDVLGKGWAGLIVLDPRWLANLCFAWCVVANLAGKQSRRMSVFGAILVVASLALPIHYFPNDKSYVVDALGTGAWLWSAALLPTFAMAFLGTRREAGDAEAGGSQSRLVGAVFVVAVAIASWFFLQPRLFPAHARFNELCKRAGIRVDVPLRGVKGVYIENDEFARNGASIRPEVRSMGEALVFNTDIGFVERKARKSHHFPDASGYQRLSMQPGPGRTPHPGNRQIHVESISEPTADYLVRATNLSEPALAEGLGGSRVEVFDRRGAMQLVARAERYWNYPPREACPEPATYSSDLDFLTRALGLKPVWRPPYVPKRR